MNLLASILLLIIAMSPAAMEALSQITGTEIISGTMDLHEGFKVEIDAIGIKKGTMLHFKCLWLNGVPVLIYSEPLGESKT